MTTPEPLPRARPALPVRTEPVRLTVIAVSEVSGPGDIFACDKLHAKLKAGDCRDRQGKAQAATTDRPSTRTLEIRKQASAHAACRACPVGRQIVEQLGRTTPGKAA